MPSRLEHIQYIEVQRISYICILNISLSHVPSINLGNSLCPTNRRLCSQQAYIVKLQLTKEVKYEAQLDVTFK